MRVSALNTSGLQTYPGQTDVRLLEHCYRGQAVENGAEQYSKTVRISRAGAAVVRGHADEDRDAAVAGAIK
jgi:hypothetical protein